MGNLESNIGSYLEPIMMEGGNDTDLLVMDKCCNTIGTERCVKNGDNLLCIVGHSKPENYVTILVYVACCLS